MFIVELEEQWRRWRKCVHLRQCQQRDHMDIHPVQWRQRDEDRELHPTFASVIDPNEQTETNCDRECLLDFAFSDRITPPGFRARCSRASSRDAVTNIVLGMQMA